MTCISYTSQMHFWSRFLSSAQRSELIFVYQCLCNLLYCLYISFNENIIQKILTKLGFSLGVCPTFGEIIQQNQKSPSTGLTAHNSTGNRTAMCNKTNPHYFHSNWCLPTCRTHNFLTADVGCCRPARSSLWKFCRIIPGCSAVRSFLRTSQLSSICSL